MKPKPTPTALTDDELWELAGIIGCSVAKVRQLMAAVLPDTTPPTG